MKYSDHYNRIFVFCDSNIMTKQNSFCVTEWKKTKRAKGFFLRPFLSSNFLQNKKENLVHWKTKTKPKKSKIIEKEVESRDELINISNTNAHILFHKNLNETEQKMDFIHVFAVDFAVDTIPKSQLDAAALC